MNFIEAMRREARGLKKHLLLLEGSESRTLQASVIILKEGIAERVTLLGSRAEIYAKAKELSLGIEALDIGALETDVRASEALSGAQGSQAPGGSHGVPNEAQGAQSSRATDGAPSHGAPKGSSPLAGLSIVDPSDIRLDAQRRAYAEEYYELRKHKGLSREQAYEDCADPLRWGFLMLRRGDADAVVAGAENSTANVLRSAFTIIQTAPGIRLVSSCFVMLLNNPQWGSNGRMIFSDCAIIPNPSAEQLADIAIAAAGSCQSFLETEPLIAMLSYSTKGSAKTPDSERVLRATEMVRQMRPDLVVDGEMQSDAALVPSVGERKAPGSAVAGRANTLIFPDLQSGNIGYKLVQRLAGAQAIGPILQGLNKPVSDLSRGASVDDIVNAAALTIIQSVQGTAGTSTQNNTEGRRA